jgi:hypothetical protein
LIPLLNKLLTIRPEEASFAKRGIESSEPALTRRLETMLESFIGGYNLAVATRGDEVALAKALNAGFDNHQVGFAFEGIGLYFAILDQLVPGRSDRLATLLKGTAAHHDFIIAVGAGFAVARVPWGVRVLDRYLKTLDPFVAWCVPGGYGFHQGFFHHKQYVDEAKDPPKSMSPIGRRLFDSGVGRSLWWVKAADPARIAAAIARFPEDRRAELWAGAGIAASYAGGVDAAVLKRLHDAAGDYEGDLLSGVPFAARLRQKAGNYSETTELACRTFLGRSTDDAADLAEAAADAVRSQVHGEGITPAYDLLRRWLVSECRTRERIGSHD